MKLSSKSLYGLKACYALAEEYPRSLSASDLEKKIFVSGKYVEKIMRMLAVRGIVRSERGKNGGYFLQKSPTEITVGEIVRVLEDDFEIVACVNEPCERCASGRVWRKLYDSMNAVLDSISLQNMLEEGENGICGEECEE